MEKNHGKFEIIQDKKIKKIMENLRLSKIQKWALQSGEIILSAKLTNISPSVYEDFMYENYPDVEIGKGLRVYPDGSRRNEKWHRKVAWEHF